MKANIVLVSQPKHNINPSESFHKLAVRVRKRGWC